MAEHPTHEAHEAHEKDHAREAPGHLAVVRRYYELVDADDVAGLVALFAPEAVYRRPGYEPLRGRAALTAFYSGTRAVSYTHLDVYKRQGQCCAFHQVDWKRAVRFATWAWYCRDDDETPQQRMARCVDIPDWLVTAAASLLTDPIQLAVRDGRPVGLVGGHLRAAAMRQQGCKHVLVAHDWPAGEPLAGELLDPATLPRHLSLIHI